ncbi:Fic family protein [Magnetovibrio sp. PR-2]|uniref:Fic family protein n=1 Tax=Magnetovibrio sp. PR-2 TaxID=3120356 RepID=UPI002FCDEA43
MKRTDLTAELRVPYTPKRGYGVMHVEEAGYENMWFVVPPAPPNDIPPNMPRGVIARANDVISRRPHWKDASQRDQLAALLLAKREALSSSRMEGTWSTIDHVLTPSEAYDDDEGRSDNLAVRGYATALYQALGIVEEYGAKSVNVDLVCLIHEMFMSKDPSFLHRAGELRAPDLAGSVVQIGGGGRKEDAIYNPAPPEHVQRCIKDVMAWMRDDVILEMGDAGMGMALPVRMAVGHAHFEAVHPFPNGNGRVGRMLWPLQMMLYGRLPLYLSGYVEAHREAYNSALQSAQKQLDYHDIVKFVCEAILGSYDEEMWTKRAIGVLPERWHERRKFREGSAAERALEVLTHTPIITMTGLQQQLNVSAPAAAKALKQLVEAEIIRERTGYKRNRVFAAEEVIQILGRPFGERPERSLEQMKT